MAPKAAEKDTDRSASLENIAFIRQMLAELRQVAERENAEMRRCSVISLKWHASKPETCSHASMAAQSVMEIETSPPAWR